MTSNDDLMKVLIEVQGDTKSLRSKLDKMESNLTNLSEENKYLKKNILLVNDKVSELEWKNKVLENKINTCEI